MTARNWNRAWFFRGPAVRDLAAISASLFVATSIDDSFAAQPPPIIPPRPVSLPAPTEADYSPLSLRLRESGIVELSVLVGVDGSCKEAQVVRSSGYPRLDATSIVLCMRRFRWEPARLLSDRSPVEGRVATRINWNLPPSTPYPSSIALSSCRPQVFP
jgi:TonB family protein